MCGTTIINNFMQGGMRRPGGPCGPRGGFGGPHGPQGFGRGGMSIFDCRQDRTAQRMNGIANIISSVGDLGNLFAGLGIFNMSRS